MTTSQNPRHLQAVTEPEPQTPSQDSHPRQIPTLPWHEFEQRFKFEQGQHATLLGPTGFGKSTMATYLQKRRAYVVVFATKKRDSVVETYRKRGFEVQRKWRPESSQRIILQPPIDPDDDRKQRQAFSEAMSSIFEEGGWCVLWDEAVYLSHFLQLDRKMSLLWQQGRSLGISIIAATQRPAQLPLYAYDAPTHIFFWRMRLDRDIERISRLGGLDVSQMRSTVESLPKYHCLYYNKETEESYIINAPKVV